MNKENLANKTIEELSLLIKHKEVSPVELARSVLENIHKKNKSLNIYVNIFEKDIIDNAVKLENEIMNKDYRGPLHGIPIGLKDNIKVKNKRITMGSNAFRDFISKRDSDVVKILRRKGAILTGMLNMDEFAYGNTNLNLHYGPCRNPINPNHITGGSSGGSAAAVKSNTSIAS